LFDPIDYVIFEGLHSKGIVTKIVFTDIKTGNAKLKSSQKEIRELVNAKKVTLKVY
jgi:predicted Holliday junction resolvase-like endonuclease